ncbi:b-box zinc finger, partial [Oesophagostomum dentatum]
SSTSSPLLNTEPLPLDDQSHCPYCHQDFRKPRVLDCLHSMCEDCIIAQLDGRRDAQKTSDQEKRNPTDCELETPKCKERPTPPGVIRCPICAQESHVGNDVRYVHTMLLDYVRLAENEEAVGERRCRACKSEQPAIAVCKQCQSDLCSNCLTAHGVMRMFEGHETSCVRRRVIILRFARNLLSKSNGMELLASRRKVVQQLNNLAHTMPALGIQVELEYQPLSKKQLDTHMNAICGNVIGRMVSANVKETISVQQPATTQAQQAQSDFPQNRSNSTVLPNVAADWGRPLSNGHGSTNDLGAIGVERKKTSTSSTWGLPPSRITGPGGDAFGWPPSSHPPDLPSPSPPIPLKDVAPPSFTVGGPGVIGQPKLKFENVVPLVPRGGIEVSAATCTSSGHLLLVDTSGVVYCIDVDVPRVVFWFDASAHLGEASDVAIYEKNVYITDFKHHCVQVFNTDGQFIRKLGEPSQTPYPIGIDVSKNGDVLVADTHGNHLHVVVFTADGTLQQSFTHNEFRLSRCVGLRVAGSGHVVTLCKHNHTLFVFKPLYIR